MSPTTIPLNLRVPPETRDRVEKLSERYGNSLNGIANVALVLGVEALEQLQASASRAEEAERDGLIE
jgi:predicted DNA-binding protein